MQEVRKLAIETGSLPRGEKMSSRKLSDLLPHVQPHAYSWLHKCFEKGIDVIVTNTYRTQEEQDEYLNISNNYTIRELE